MEEASARANSVGILVKRMLGVADDVAMRFPVPISSRNKNSLSFPFHYPVRLVKYTLQHQENCIYIIEEKTGELYCIILN